MDKKTIIILNEKYNLKANKQIAFEIKKAGFTAKILKPSCLQAYLSDKNSWDLIYDNFGNKPERIYTGNVMAVIPRIGKYLSYSSFIVEQFTNKGIYSPQTAKSLLIASDKMKTLQKCSGASLRVPKTMFIRDSSNVDFIISKIGLPFIIKTLNGSQGKGVAVIDTKRSALSIIDALLKTNKSLILQEFIGTGEDIRVIVVGNKVVASMIRTKNKGNDFRANLSLGGSAEKIELDQTIKTFCVNASKAVGLDISGVDIMFDKNGSPVIIEVNTNFGWKIQNITKVNIAKEIVSFVIEKSKNESVKQKYNTNFIFENSSYLHNAFIKSKGKKLDFIDRKGNENSVLIKNIEDIYSVMEQTFKIQ